MEEVAEGWGDAVDVFDTSFVVVEVGLFEGGLALVPGSLDGFAGCCSGEEGEEVADAVDLAVCVVDALVALGLLEAVAAVEVDWEIGVFARHGLRLLGEGRMAFWETYINSDQR